MMMLHESRRFSEPINKGAQNVCWLFTLHISVFVCEFRTRPLNRCVTKVADAYFYGCWVTQMLLLRKCVHRESSMISIIESYDFLPFRTLLIVFVCSIENNAYDV